MFSMAAKNSRISDRTKLEISGLAVFLTLAIIFSLQITTGYGPSTLTATGLATGSARNSVTGLATGTCSHDVCVEGDKLANTCDPCVTKVCASDAYCCNNKWDIICVGEVKSICGQSCTGGGNVPPAPSSYKGNVDILDCSQIAGWACESANGGQVTIDVYAGNIKFPINANKASETAVNDICHGTSGYRFSYAVPYGFKAAVNVKFGGYSTTIQGGSKTLDCTQAPEIKINGETSAELYYGSAWTLKILGPANSPAKLYCKTPSGKEDCNGLAICTTDNGEGGSKYIWGECMAGGTIAEGTETGIWTEWVTINDIKSNEITFNVKESFNTGKPFHPADTNKDWSIVIGEVTAYGNGAHAASAADIWKNGEKYTWDDKILNWIPFHPADTNHDLKITIGEVTAYGNGQHAKSASDIWKNGEKYTWDFNAKNWIPWPSTASSPDVNIYKTFPSGNPKVNEKFGITAWANDPDGILNFGVDFNYTFCSMIQNGTALNATGKTVWQNYTCSKAGIYNFTASATDFKGASASAKVQIDVVSSTSVSTLNASIKKPFWLNTPFTLTAQASSSKGVSYIIADPKWNTADCILQNNFTYPISDSTLAANATIICYSTGQKTFSVSFMDVNANKVTDYVNISINNPAPVTSTGGSGGGPGGPVCGNGVCEVGENNANCPGDCPGGGTNTCSHSICTMGSKLDKSCDPCVTKICGVDPYCCNNNWDGVCVTEVKSICGQNTCG